ncbi:MAG: hypothetical protein LUC25_00630 [Ruminococcus sp.]|nr:hypothetical protein [Ruminococcus sp.]
MKLGKNAIATILSTVVLAACVVVSLATSSDDEEAFSKLRFSPHTRGVIPSKANTV